MPQLKDSDSHYWRNIATRTLLVMACSLLIVSILPRRQGQAYKYEIGKPWMGDAVIAKFKFPVMKTEEAIEEERAALRSSYQPYFTFDASVETKAVEDFNRNFDEKLAGMLFIFKPHIIRRLHQVYQRGIMSAPEYARYANDSTTLIRLVNGKTATTCSINEVLSTMNAYEQLFIDEQLTERRSLLQRYDLNQYIRPNLTYDKERNDQELEELLNSIAPSDGQVENGQKIIDRGEIVDEATARKLDSLEKEIAKRDIGKQESLTTIIGQLLYVIMLMMLFTIYLQLFRRDYFDKPRSLLMVYALITLIPILVSVMMRYMVLSVYILPIAIVAIFVRIFLDSHTAVMAHTTAVMISANAVNYQEEFFVIQMVAGMAAIYSLRELSRRSQIFQATGSVMMSTCVMYYALTLIHHEGFVPQSYSMYIHLIMGAILLLLAYPLMFIMEKAFGFTSDVTLFEISDTNKDLLRQLSEVAPGTFQHSITVGNLASEIANRIGADALLVRTGALYHDIGKMVNPVFFTENQAGVNPHDNLSEKESAQIIIGHVTEGLKLAEQDGLPVDIKNFIITHHGTGLTGYFYAQYKNAHPDEEVDTAPFSYPGPNPFTREQAILMMADTVEAASRSLSEYTEESISNMVDRLIENQVKAGYFRECPITFRDILNAKQVLTERLRAIYHTRIKYPDIKKSSPAR